MLVEGRRNRIASGVQSNIGGGGAQGTGLRGGGAPENYPNFVGSPLNKSKQDVFS